MNELEEKFIHYAKMQCVSSQEGDYKTGNLAYKNLITLKKQIMENSKVCNNIIDELLMCTDPFVKFWACSLARDHNYRISDVISILTDIANDESLKIISHNAKMTLKHKL